MLQVVLGIFVLSFLVILHELGHFIAAKICKIPVMAFSVGFGKPLFKRVIGGTEFRICPFLLGGYVQMEGEEVGKETENGFSSRPVWQRAFVAISGPAVNLITALIFLIIMNSTGVPFATYLDSTRVGLVEKESPLSKELQSGDSLVSINGKPVTNWQEVDFALKDLSPSHTILYVRNAQKRTATVHIPLPDPKEIEKFEHGLLPYMAPVIGEIDPDSPAAQGKLAPLDTIFAIDGTSVKSWYDVSDIVQKSCGTGKKEIEILVKRGAETLTLSITPKSIEEQSAPKQLLSSSKEPSTHKRFIIGVRPRTEQYIKKFSVSESLSRSVETWKEYFAMIFDMLKKIGDGEVKLGHMSGPLSIILISGTAAQAGFAALLNFMALISVNLGTINLLPLVITDGGILAMLAIELIIRKPVPQKIHQALVTIFTVLFLSLFVYISCYDILRIPLFWGR